MYAYKSPSQKYACWYFCWYQRSKHTSLKPKYWFAVVLARYLVHKCTLAISSTRYRVFDLPTETSLHTKKCSSSNLACIYTSIHLWKPRFAEILAESRAYAWKYWSRYFFTDLPTEASRRCSYSAARGTQACMHTAPWLRTCNGRICSSGTTLRTKFKRSFEGVKIFESEILDSNCPCSYHETQTISESTQIDNRST